MEKNRERKIVNILRRVGVPANLEGYKCIKVGLDLILDNSEYEYAITKKLYPDIAKIINSTSSKVERNIRHAVEVCWDSNNEEVLHIFGNTVNPNKGNPTNSQFLSTLAEVYRLEED